MSDPLLPSSRGSRIKHLRHPRRSARPNQICEVFRCDFDAKVAAVLLRKHAGIFEGKCNNALGNDGCLDGRLLLGLRAVNDKAPSGAREHVAVAQHGRGWVQRAPGSASLSVRSHKRAARRVEHSRTDKRTLIIASMERYSPGVFSKYIRIGSSLMSPRMERRTRASRFARSFRSRYDQRTSVFAASAESREDLYQRASASGDVRAWCSNQECRSPPTGVDSFGGLGFREL